MLLAREVQVRKQSVADEMETACCSCKPMLKTWLRSQV